MPIHIQNEEAIETLDASAVQKRLNRGELGPGYIDVVHENGAATIESGKILCGTVVVTFQVEVLTGFQILLTVVVVALEIGLAADLRPRPVNFQIVECQSELTRQGADEEFIYGPAHQIGTARQAP